MQSWNIGVVNIKKDLQQQKTLQPNPLIQFILRQWLIDPCCAVTICSSVLQNQRCNQLTAVHLANGKHRVYILILRFKAVLKTFLFARYLDMQRIRGFALIRYVNLHLT